MDVRRLLLHMKTAIFLSKGSQHKACRAMRASLTGGTLNLSQDAYKINRKGDD